MKKKFNTILIKGVGGEFIVLDVDQPINIMGDKDDAGRAFVITGGFQFKVPHGPLVIDHVIRKARGLGLREGVQLETQAPEQQNRKQRIDHVIRKARGLGLREGVQLETQAPEQQNRKQRRAASKKGR